MAEGRLVVCATPIGNLGDVSARLADALGDADHIYAEDTRRAAILLDHLGIEARTRSLFAGNEAARTKELTGHLARGETVALITDAGTPTISDPGAAAVAEARRMGAVVTVIPGASAVTAALAVSGMDATRFVFEGFLERKGRRRAKQLASIAGENRTIVVFLSPHRLIRDLSDLRSVTGGDREIMVARELTKLYEETWWGTIDAAVEHWTDTEPRGEFTAVIAGAPPRDVEIGETVTLARRLIEEGMTLSEAARAAAEQTGVKRGLVYESLLSDGDLKT